MEDPNFVKMFQELVGWMNTLPKPSKAPKVESSKNAMLAAQYSQKVNYVQNKELKFPDFTLEYTGMTKREDGSFIVSTQHFTLKDDGVSREIAWSSGNGGIVPTSFSASGKKFVLYLHADDHHRFFSDEELIVAAEPGQ
jgi:hypothetical protein